MAVLTFLWEHCSNYRFFSFIKVVIVVPSLYLLIRAVYRIFLHPLRAFPGPKLRAISHIPHAIAGTKGRAAFDVRDLHARYGEVVRIAPDLLSFMTPSFWQDIHGHAAAKKFPKYGYFKARGDAQPLLTADEKDYPRQRAALMQGFSERAIAGQESTLKRHIDLFMKRLEENSERIDMSQWFQWLTFDLIGEFALSNHPWVAILVRWFRAVSFATNANEFGMLAPVLMLFTDIKDLMGIKIHQENAAAAVKKRLEMEDDPNRNDIWSYILRRKHENPLSLGEMEINAAALLIAATSPVADTLSGAIYFLSRNPKLTLSSTSKMPYLHAVMNETMRCYTPTPGGGRRQAPPGGATVSGHYVPGGTVVAVYQLPAFTLPNNFALPDCYLPERWLPIDHPDSPKATLTDEQEVFQPFSVGPKACIGKGYAYAEIKLILARVVWHFDFELLDNGFAVEKQRAFLFRERPPLNVKLSVRQH
ncbi:cytochrome P450 [Lophiostoma macrostomum CBS 122681]|uniref:Cytochrome P450 n=1 Tax=Lophiostoma macrostomum CBS 122681 TaxID=1314788 RepID=A0A6A6T555_9PLEO|nr:cytochrome P450 [Lophiostoma macrostomum CBS 122681]